jgi:hypothetical protein
VANGGTAPENLKKVARRPFTIRDDNAKRFKALKPGLINNGKEAPQSASPFTINGGEGGIRTRGSGLSHYKRLAGARLRPTRPPLRAAKVTRKKRGRQRESAPAARRNSPGESCEAGLYTETDRVTKPYVISRIEKLSFLIVRHAQVSSQRRSVPFRLRRRGKLNFRHRAIFVQL